LLVAEYAFFVSNRRQESLCFQGLISSGFLSGWDYLSGGPAQKKETMS